MTAARVLVVAKAPVPGLVKTRLAATIGDAAAAEVAAAALLDTMGTCRRAFGAEHCLMSLAGDLADAVRTSEIESALEGWTVTPQRGDTFAQRLANAHADVPAGGPVVQIGMDTPQVTVDLLRAVVEALEGDEAVLGPADDGGWWVLALRDPVAARVLSDVEMSTTTTYADTRAALERLGLVVASTATLRDVDTVGDADRVAAESGSGAFVEAWRAVSP